MRQNILCYTIKMNPFRRNPVWFQALKEEHYIYNTEASYHRPSYWRFKLAAKKNFSGLAVKVRF